MNSRPSYDSETARRVDLEFVCVFGHECVHRRLACSVGDSSTGASAIKCWWLMRNLFACYSLSMISRDAVLSAMLAGLTTWCLTFRDIFVCTPTSFIKEVRRHRQAN